MVESVSIKRRKSSDNELSFENLRSEAIKLLQRFSGQTWTDYNLHDPGITILEQLIYALTDLIYRSDFAVEDYLADGEGKIDLDEQYLHQPAQVLSCRPTTALDYRKLMLDAVPTVDNVWLTAKSNSSQYRGLYQLLVKLKQGLDKTQRDSAIEQLTATYHGARNLCEDLDPGDIRVMENLEFDLCARIEMSSAHDPAELLAKIYFTCARRMASSVSITSYDQLVAQDRPLDQLFDGPSTSHGFIVADDAHEPRREFLVSTLFATINDIKGVDHIRELYLERNNKQHHVRIQTKRPERAFDLSVPKPGKKLKVELTTNGRVMPIMLDQVIARYEEISFKDNVSRTSRQTLKLISEPIRAASRPLTQYFSIQDQLPFCYGVNQQGVSGSADVATRARARQLKAYLLIFEQLMVNFLANIGAIKTLSSAVTDESSSYAVQVLTEQQVADLNAVYPQHPGDVIGRIMARFDDYNDRKSRFLDYLLALYGERFSQNSLRHFNYYEKDEIERKIVANKVDFLKSIIELGRDRAAAPAYDGSLAERDHCGLTLRAAMLLGFERRQTRSLTAAIADQGYGLRTHLEYQALKAGSEELRIFSSEELHEHGYDSLYPSPSAPPDADISIIELREKIVDILPLQYELLSEKLLTAGVSMEHYFIGDSRLGQDFRLLLKIDDDRYWHLGDYADKPVMIEAANCLRQLMLSFNRDSEGLYIVEHLLLRPRGTESTDDNTPGDDFFSCKISVVLPSWTLRCSNPDFQNLVRETLRLNAPAHVLPEFCWLDFVDMIEFERLNDAWRELKTSQSATPVELDRRASELITFLLAHHEKWLEQE
jgi:hypothetical protein